MSRILVTGASGLIGRELLPVLARGPDEVFEVFAVGRSAAELPNYLLCDLGDPAAARRAVAEIQPDAVVHLAGGAAPDRHRLYRDNVLSTVYLLEAVSHLATAPYCLVFGSAAEYGDATAGRLGESSPLAPCTDYGRAKVAQTTLAESICRQRGIPLTVLRPFNLVSPSLPPSTALGNMRRQLLAAGSGGRAPGEQERRNVRPIRCGRLDVVRDFVPLSFVVEAVRRLLAAPSPGLAINVCSGVGLELGELLAALARRLGLELAILADAHLAAMPVASRVVGDPSLLRDLCGLAIVPSADSLAEILLAD